jgi:hypothetical protein
MHPVHGTLQARETKLHTTGKRESESVSRYGPEAQLIHLRSGDVVEPEVLAEVMQGGVSLSSFTAVHCTNGANIESLHIWRYPCHARSNWPVC